MNGLARLDNIAGILPSRYSSRLVAAVNPKFRELGYQLGVAPGRTWDRIIIQDRELGMAPYLWGWVRRADGALCATAGLNSPQMPQRAMRRGNQPIVRFRLDDPESFALAVEVADPEAVFLLEAVPV